MVTDSVEVLCLKWKSIIGELRMLLIKKWIPIGNIKVVWHEEFVFKTILSRSFQNIHALILTVTKYI